MALGSRTSGVDGSSEGGRINTIDLPGALVLYGVALMQTLQARGNRSKLTVAPVKVDGIWCLELTYQGDPPAGVPDKWHGHRVVVVKAAPPPPPPAPPAPPAPAPAPRLRVPETFTPESRIHDVVERLGDRGRDLLRKHGYEVGEGFVDVLSQYQTLEHAYQTERLRNLNDMLAELNSAQ